MSVVQPQTVAEAEEQLSEPTPKVIELLSKLDGDILVLGVAGKMGPTLARMARKTLDQLGRRSKVIGVARFSNAAEQQKLEAWNIPTIKANLLDEKALKNLPDAPNIVYMAGMKFGSTGNEPLTWAMNAFLPGLVCQRYPISRIAAFSTGNIYGLSPISYGGSVESDPLNPIGDYAMSCLGRERIFQHFSQANGTPVSIIRLNYACEVRYGVLIDLAVKVWTGQPVDLSMGASNVTAQADANAMALGSLALASIPAFVLNVAGPETLSVRRVCEQLGQLMDRKPSFVGAESGDALLNNGQLGHRLFGYPRMSADQLIQMSAAWVRAGGEMLNKPTHFEARSGKF